MTKETLAVIFLGISYVDLVPVLQGIAACIAIILGVWTLYERVKKYINEHKTK